MNKFREKFLKQLSFFKQGGAITKFQSPAGPIDASMHYAITTGRPVPTYRITKDDVKGFYDLSHNGGSGLTYQLINGGLYALAPFTGGATLPAAIAMSAGAMGSAGNDIVDRGINLENGMDIGFDVLNAAGGAGQALKYLNAVSKVENASTAAGRAFLNFDKAATEYSAAQQAAIDAAVKTAKLQNRVDALGAVMGGKATLNPKWRSLNNAASEAVKEAVFHSSNTPINTVGRTGTITGRAAERAAVKDAAYKAALRERVKADQRLAAANYVANQAKGWRTVYAPWALGQNAANQKVQELAK